MAVLKLNNVTTITESSGAITITPNTTASGNLTVSGDLVPSTPLSHRNMVYNGGMKVAQRGTSFSPTTEVTYLMDGWRTAHGNIYNFDTTITRVATGFNETGQTYCMKVEADAGPPTAPATSDNGGISHIFEGQDLQHLQYGGSNAKDIVLSFWAKVSTNAVGTYTVQPRFYDGSTYHSQYHAISLTTTWTQYEILIPANGSALTSAITNTNTKGLEIFWFLCAGVDDIVSATSTWNDITGYRGVTGQTNFLDSADNEFYLTGVQLELGSNATPFEHRTFQDDLLSCQRYFYVIGSNRHYIAGRTSGSSGMHCAPTCPVPMNHTPAIGLATGKSRNYDCINQNGATGVNSAIAIETYSTDITGGTQNTVGNLHFTGGSGFTDGRVCCVRTNEGITFESELS